MDNSLRSWSDLETFLVAKGLSWEKAHLPSKELTNATFPPRIPVHYANLIDWESPDDPLRKMVVPSSQEESIHEYELADPIGDHDREAVPGLIHRYPDRCLLLLTSYCLVHCRFCFRKEVVGKVRPVEFLQIKEYIAAHPEIHEVIFSGGDPATFPAGFLHSVSHHFHQLKSVKRYRFHTRVPAVDPQAITDEWLDAAAALPAEKKIVVIHINHVRELSPETRNLIAAMLQRKFLVLSQSVLLKGVNNSVKDLTELFTSLISSGVKPYYLHHLDKAKGTHQFRISIEAGKALFQQLRGNVSGVCLPEYVLDLPGGFGKVPVMWLEKIGDKMYTTTTFENKKVTYTDPA